jgi:Sulfotransferase family
MNTPSCLILGIHYGGTSLVAGIVEALGYDLGNYEGPNDSHPHGEKEDLDFLTWALGIAINDRAPQWPMSRAQVRPLRELIYARDDAGIPWAVKFPLMSLYGKWALDHMRNPKIVHVERNLNAATASYAAKENISLEEARSIHALYLSSLYTTVREHPSVPYHSIRYEDLIENPEREIIALNLFLHEPPTDLEALSRAVSLVLPTWKHF